MGVKLRCSNSEVAKTMKMKGVKNLDDSGFFDDCETVLDNSVQFDSTSENVFEVEDADFDIIESSLEALLLEQDDLKSHKYSLRRRERSSEVKSLGIKTEPCEPVSAQTCSPQRLTRKRGRPAKTKTMEESIGNDSKECCLENSEPNSITPKRTPRKRGRPSKNNSIKAEEDVLLEESPDKKAKLIGNNKNRKSSRPQLPADYEMSPYEKIREANIREREEMLIALGIKEALDECKNDVGIGNKVAGPRKQKVEQSERRRSSRLEGKEVEDADYDPEDESNDPSDHTHDGLRKHPCKECSNCIRPDCRRCVFCKDKRKYGGPNIKKQKCEYKEKCSQPIILCFICNGKRTFSCNECGKQFHETYQLDEHNKDIPQSQPVVRRSARLTGKATLDPV